ncbi:MAG: acetolactate synthase [candidate division Zixibacteria bacterium RBG_16_53_22]|nr:MAG: acetolactate synthase [candidate division Zixibacteria bacterium RBG_16_53_22]
MKLSDYVAERIVEAGIRHVFMITGGGAMHLNNSLGKHPRLEVLFNHHEQAAAMAAESYARVSGKCALVCVTSGPGGTNAITGVLGAWQDSIPMLVVSGQVRYDTTVRSTGIKLRQLGDQEFDITKAVESMTKYCVMVTEPSEIRYHLERAICLAQTGRPGPCWIDIPMNVQGAAIDPAKLSGHDPAEDPEEVPPVVPPGTIREIIALLGKAKRPVVMAGSAIWLAGAQPEFLKLVDLLNIPVVTAFNAHDCIPSAHPFFVGRPGTIGDRAGNFAVQNSDALLVLGCRLNIRQIGYSWKTFAREAYKIVVDIDPLELAKPTVTPDLPVLADVGEVIRLLVRELPANGLPGKGEWLEWCRQRKERYPVVLKEYWERDKLVNPYCFVEVLTEFLPEGQIIVTGDGTACVCTFQAAQVKKGQRLYSNSGCAPMGYDLPAAIGACVGSGRSRIVCLAGDGSIQMNLQELQTIVHNKLPIKIFVINNNGYHSIRQTQENFFGRPLVGCDPESGVSFPDMEKIAGAFGIPFVRCATHQDLTRTITGTLGGDGPSMCEVMVAPDQPFAPKTSSHRLPDGRIVSRPLEDLAPFLDRNEFLGNMIISPLED